jgi:hypothetical protein
MNAVMFKSNFKSGKFQGKVNFRKGINAIAWNSDGADQDYFFSESLYNILGKLNFYTVCKYGEVNEREIFIICKDKEEIKTQINCNITNIVNYDLTSIDQNDLSMIHEALKKICYSFELSSTFSIDETIFWDVNNDFVIVIGKANLLKLLNCLAIESYKALINPMCSDEFLENLIGSTPFIKKIKRAGIIKTN